MSKNGSASTLGGSPPAEGGAAEQELAKAVALLGKGRLEPARRITEALFEGHRGDARALCVSADVEFRLGNRERALELVNRSIAIDRSIPRAHHVLANICQDLGKIDRAISSYRRALRLNPYFAEAHNDLGHAYFEKGWPKEALGCFEKATKIAPEHEVAYENLGQIYRRQKRPVEARRYLQRALRLKLKNALRRLFRLPAVRPGLEVYFSGSPSELGQRMQALLQQTRDALTRKDYVAAEAACREALKADARSTDARYMLGYTLGQSGRIEEGIEALRELLTVNADQAEVHFQLGKLYARSRRLDQAMASYQAALKLAPDHAEAHSDLSSVYQNLGLTGEAEASARRALRCNPALAQAHNNLAVALFWAGAEPSEAERHCHEALRLKPELSEVRANLGLVLKEQGRLKEALSVLDEGLRLNPNDATLHLNRGLLLQEGYARFDDALVDIRKAQFLDPEFDRAHLSEGLLLLLQSKYAEGWAKYAWRLRTPRVENLDRYIDLPKWGGEPLTGKTLLVVGEQGLGDEIMFASCFPELLSRDGRCVLTCSSRVAPLLKRAFPTARVHPLERPEQAKAVLAETKPDLKIAAGSVPAILRRDAASFAAHQGYLRADPERVARWRAELGKLGDGPKIGVSWRGGIAPTGRFRRSIDLAGLAPMLSTPGCTWVSLQFGEVEREIEQLRASSGVRLLHRPEAITNMEELAALIECLDLTLTVCNTNVHLAGALGRPAWVLAPFVAEWRYGVSGEKMIWYPSVRVFRQRAFGDWESVIAPASTALARWRETRQT